MIELAGRGDIGHYQFRKLAKSNMCDSRPRLSSVAPTSASEAGQKPELDLELGATAEWTWPELVVQ